jgi:hypothetical protein
MRRVRENNVGVEKQYVLSTYSECVCVCGLSYPARKAHALCYIFMCGLSGSTNFFFSHELITATISGKPY